MSLKTLVSTIVKKKKLSPIRLKTIRDTMSGNYYAQLPYHRFELPQGILVQEVNNRQSKLCKTCGKSPENKRLLVIYFYTRQHRTSTAVYCQDCAREFLKQCDQSYNILAASLKKEII